MKILFISIALLLLLAGCARLTTDSYCDIASPLYFDTDETVSWLLQNDRTLLVDIIVHNETARRICGTSRG